MSNPMSNQAGSSSDSYGKQRALRRSRMEDKRILYVEDCPLMRAAMTRLLRGFGAVCLGTGTHDQAVVLLAFESVVDLAIIDFEMPDGDVSHLIRRLRRQRPALPLVGTSASDRRADFAERGVVRYLPKPFGVDDLIRVATSCNTPDDRGSAPSRSIPSLQSRRSSATESAPSPRDLQVWGDIRERDRD